jgi:pyruvate dehydrogenase E2 component (dihydrolipoamide acetyltransferase)
MTQTIAFRLPRLGGAEAEARILGWRRSPGDAIERDEVLLEVETDKAVVEVLAPCDGVLLDHLRQPDQIAEFDDALAHIEVRGELPAGIQPEEASHGTSPVADASAPSASPLARLSPAPLPAQARTALSGRIAASPYARRIAAEHDLDLASMSGSGPQGRVVSADVLRHVGTSAPAAAVPARSRDRTTDTEVNTSRGAIACRMWNDQLAHLPAVVLVHGLFGDIDVWSGLAGSLAAAGRRVLALDLPAHGRTRAEAVTLDDIAVAVDELLTAAAGTSFVLVGHSFGAAVAARCAARRAGRGLHALVLLSPAGLGTGIAADFLDGMVHAGSVAVLRRELEKLGDQLPALGESILQTQLDGLQRRARPLQELIRHFAQHGVQQIDIRQDLATATFPVDIYWGRRDRILPWEHALNAPPRASLHLIPNVGHMPQWEAGTLIAERLIQLSEP